MPPRTNHAAPRTRGQLLAAERAWSGAPQRIPLRRATYVTDRPLRLMLAIYVLATLANAAIAGGWL